MSGQKRGHVLPLVELFDLGPEVIPTGVETDGGFVEK
jgi:hypothetical protein